ncbi:MAG: aminoacyl-tRNA deacylase [Rhodospirillaceae bacterium]
MPAKRLKDFLDSNQVKYVAITHSLAYTSQEIAQSVHIPGNKLAKTVVVKVDGKMAMAVLPGTEKVSVDMLKEATGAATVELATEREFQDRFPECDIGAMPPFGNLYGMDVYASPHLAKHEIAFNAGTHTEVIRMPYQDWERLVMPKIVELSRQPMMA